MEWPKWKTENPQDKQTKTEKIRHSSKLIRPEYYCALHLITCCGSHADHCPLYVKWLTLYAY